MNDERTGIKLSITLQGYSPEKKVLSVRCFCATCSLTRGGFIGEAKRESYFEDPDFQLLHKYCPTCGRELDYQDVERTEHYDF
ncbi:hypothetical protein J6A31_05940 [bacterium]|nr:hypothetical protein [bacterium]